MEAEANARELQREAVYLATAQLFAGLSTCQRGHVGAVLVEDRRIIATGYNGAPPGMAHCYEVGCEQELFTPEGHVSAIELPGCVRTVHAEANAIAFAGRKGVRTAGASMYCTHSPCRACALLLASAGIKEIIYIEEYRATPWDLLDELGIAYHKRGNGALTR